MPNNQEKTSSDNNSKAKHKHAKGNLRESEAAFHDSAELQAAQDILHESEERYRSIINGAAEGFWLINPQLETVEVNESLCRMLEYSREEMLGKKPFDFADKANAKIFKEQTAKIPGTSQRHYDIVLKSKSGKYVYARFNATTVRDKHGGTVSAFAFVTDITELKLAERSLLESKEMMEQLYRVMPCAIFTVDVDGTITGFNKKAEEITGYTAEEVIGKKCPIFAINACKKGCSLYARNVTKPIMGRECTIRRKDGEERIISKNSDLLKDANGCTIGGVESFEDVTEQKQAAEMLNYLAYYDALTGLPNRMLFYDRFTTAINQAQRNREALALVFLDLDNFKTVNDTLGHSIGDQLLHDVAIRLKNKIRKADTIARLGGDEFTILLPRLKRPEDAAKITQKIIDTLRPPFSYGGREFHITASAGVALYPNDGDTTHALLRNADIALYRAKEFGKDSYQFYMPAMGYNVLERLALESNVRKALERQEFLLYYQPIIDIRSGKIAAMEALLRWQHPDYGLVYPVEFIPILEETGLIIPVGEWVINAACNQARTWQDRGLPPIRIAVNLSPRQFQQQDMVEMVARALDKSGLNPERLELEITESAVMKDVDSAVMMFHKLKEMGTYISVDDFATGYSSLSFLKRFPADTLKIDQSFIRDLMYNASDAEIAKAIIALAHNLGMKAIAEGVETVEQLEFLRGLKCDEIQGHVFSLPLSVQDATELLITEMRLCA